MLSQGYVLNTYEIRSVIGRGGFGIVYKGRHTELGITIAIKEYFPSELSVRYGETVQASDPELKTLFEEGLQRFLGEAKQLVKFRDHPNIVTCTDLFLANGTAYMIMEYVQGLTLSALLERRESQGNPFTEQELLDLVRPLLTGLQSVHDSGICHRDIKPSNILVRFEDSTPVLIDFGAAKHEISRHTKSLAPYTDGYAAMEQVGEGEIGPWTDMYGLGAVMWRMIAGGNPPFSPPNPPIVQKRTFEVVHGRSDPLPSAKSIGKKRFSNRTLKAIDKCLVINMDKRTQNCTQLLDALDLSTPAIGHSEDNSGFVYRGGKVLRGIAGVKDKGEAAKIKSTRRTRRWLVALTIVTLSVIILVALIPNLPFMITVPQLGPRIISQEEFVLTHDDQVSTVEFSPDGSQLVSGSWDETVRFWNVSTAEEVRRLTWHTDRVNAVAFSPDGMLLASGSRDNTIRLWNVSTETEERNLIGDTNGYSVNSLDFSPDGTLLASGLGRRLHYFWKTDLTIRLWDLPTGLELSSFSAPADRVNSVAFSPDGMLLGSGSWDSIIRLWDVSTAEEVDRFIGHTSAIHSVAFSSDGTLLASASEDHTVRLWGVHTGVEEQNFIGHTDQVNSVAFSPKGDLLASGAGSPNSSSAESSDYTVRLWEVSTGEEVLRFTGHDVWVNTVVFSPDGNLLASGSGDHTVRIWKVDY